MRALYNLSYFPDQVVTLEDAIAGALCDVMEQALIDRGIAPDLARQLAKRACEPSIQKAVTKARKGAKRKLSAYDRALKRALKQVNDVSRTKSGKLRKGMTQRKVMQRAHKLAKRMMK